MVHSPTIMFPNFDPSKMDPKALMELSQLIQRLPPEQLNRLQSLMHNMMAGHDVQKDMEEFEKTLPTGFREKLLSIMMSSGAGPLGAPAAGRIEPISSSVEIPIDTQNMEMREARLTVLRAVADGRMSPEEADRLLFPE